jgi:ribosome-binding protein aMBF1 (putative translation factor)
LTQQYVTSHFLLRRAYVRAHNGGVEKELKDIGHRLRSLREARGWSQAQLARALSDRRGADIDQPQVSHWESGASMRRSTAAFLARFIDEQQTPKQAG